VATVGAQSITLEEVDDRAMREPTERFGNVRLSQALHQARRLALDELVGRALIDQEAKRLGLERTTLIDQEINSKVRSVTDADVESWYKANQARVQGAPLDDARSAIRAYLTQERVDTVRRQYLDTLRVKTTVRITLEPPRQRVSIGKAPAKGPAGAPIEIIEFSDFQCPFCQKANAIVDQVLKEYGDRIRFAYRHFPLPNHPDARPAAEASQCAAEQNRFWPYHDKLFANPSRLSTVDLKQHAADLGLEAKAFNSCVDTHKYGADVQADIEAGVVAGGDATPAFFINGRMVSGAQPFDVFKRVIDEELARPKP
jgi:protein-disulfide isomerase